MRPVAAWLLTLSFATGCECTTACVECGDASLDARRVDVGADAPMQIDAARDAWEPDATGSESCAPGRGRVPVDEDRDGHVDEGCPFYIGPIHPVLAAMPVDDDVLGGVRYVGADITNNATRLFTSAVVDGSPRHEVLVFRRGSPREPFAPETRIVFAESPSAVSASEDGSQLFVEFDNATRVRAFAWTGGTPSLIATFESFGQPAVRRDGRELFMTRGGSIYASHIDQRGAWSGPEVVHAGGFPILSEDALTLYFTEAGTLRKIERTHIDEAFRGGATSADFARLASGQVVRPFHVVDTRELFFSLQTVDGLAVPAQGPTRAALFRAEVCRDAPCVPEAIPCAGTRSDDGLHCYREGSTTTYSDAVGRCTGSAHLVSIHSAEELRLVATAFPNAWLGARGRRWQSGEPFLFSTASGLPSDVCLIPTTDAWRAESCTNMHEAVCEAELWPTFTD